MNQTSLKIVELLNTISQKYTFKDSYAKTLSQILHNETTENGMSHQLKLLLFPIMDLMSFTFILILTAIIIFNIISFFLFPLFYVKPFRKRKLNIIKLFIPFYNWIYICKITKTNYILVIITFLSMLLNKPFVNLFPTLESFLLNSDALILLIGIIYTIFGLMLIIVTSKKFKNTMYPKEAQFVKYVD